MNLMKIDKNAVTAVDEEKLFTLWEAAKKIERFKKLLVTELERRYKQRLLKKIEKVRHRTVKAWKIKPDLSRDKRFIEERVMTAASVLKLMSPAEAKKHIMLVDQKTWKLKESK